MTRRKRQIRILIFVLLTTQVALSCLYSRAEAESFKFLGLNSRFDSQEGLYFSKFYPKEFLVTFQGRKIGEIALEENLGSSLIPLGALSLLMDWQIAIDHQNQIATGLSPVNAQKITIVPRLRTLFIGAEAITLGESQVNFFKDDVYIDLDVLNAQIGVKATLDRNTLTLDISYGLNAENILKIPPSFKSDVITEELSETVMPAIPPASVDQPNDLSPEDKSKMARAPPQPMPEPILTDQDTGEGPSVQSEPPKPEAVSALSAEEDVLVLQLLVNDIPMAELIDVLNINGQAMLPLCGLANIFEYPITCSADHSSADGWFVREENTFTLSGDKVTVRGKSNTLSADEIIRNSEDIYIKQELMQAWFDISLTTNPRRMELSVVSKNPFAFEERMRREQLREQMEAKRRLQEAEKVYIPYSLPYQPYAYPVVDLNLNSAYDEASTPRHTSNYNLAAAGDLGYMTSRLYASGDLANSALTDMRLSFGRDDYKKELLGGLKASSFRFGDINSIGISQIAQSTEGRGVVFTNRDINRADKFDVITFNGDSTPGWDAELYRNDTLIDSKVIGTDGRYEFKDVPILFGNNVFRILLQGPQGQIEERVETINADSSIIDKGAFTYNVSMDDKSKRLFDFRGSTPNHPDGIRTAAEFEFGMQKWLTGTIGLARTMIPQGTRNYVETGARMTFLGVLSNISHARIIGENAHSTRLTSFANFYGTNVRFTQKVANNFRAEQEATAEHPTRLSTGLDLDRSVTLPFLGSLSTGLFLEREIDEANQREDTARLRLSKNFRGFNFSNTLQNESGNTRERVISGSFSLRGTVARNLLTLTGDYELQPLSELEQVNFSWVRNLTPKIVNNFSVLRRFNEPDNKYKYENTITFDLDRFKLYFTGRTDSRNDLYAGIGLSLSAAHFGDQGWRTSSRPRAESGMIRAQTFMDNNFNLTRDEGEEPAKDVDLKIGPRTYRVDQDGLAMGQNLMTTGPVMIHALDKKFKQRASERSIDGYELDLRPGMVAEVNFPIFRSVEVEGMVELPQGIVLPRDVKISLLNEAGQVAAEAAVEFDGYYLFRGLLPGRYTLHLPEDVLAAKALEIVENELITIGSEDDFITSHVVLATVRNDNK